MVHHGRTVARLVAADEPLAWHRSRIAAVDRHGWADIEVAAKDCHIRTRPAEGILGVVVGTAVVVALGYNHNLAGDEEVPMAVEEPPMAVEEEAPKVAAEEALAGGSSRQDRSLAPDMPCCCSGSARIDDRGLMPRGRRCRLMGRRKIGDAGRSSRNQLGNQLGVVGCYVQ